MNTFNDIKKEIEEVTSCEKGELKAKKVVYSEPEDYFPKSVRKSAKLGEFATDSDGADKEKKKISK